MGRHFVNISREQLQLQRTLAECPHTMPIPWQIHIHTYVFVRCGAFQFYPFYWLCIFYSCLKFIHKYSDSARIARQSPPPSTYIYSLSFHTSNSNCCMACPIAIPSHPIPSLTSPRLLRFVCKLVYWNFLFAFCPVSSVCPPPPLYGAFLDAFITWLNFGLIAYASHIAHTHTHTSKSNRLVYSICALKSEFSTRFFSLVYIS